LNSQRLALSVIIIVTLATSLVAWLFWQDLDTKQKEVDILHYENGELQDDKRSLLFEAESLRNQNSELAKQLKNLTEQLALARTLHIEIVDFMPDGWSNYGPYLGVERYRNVFNVTVQNNDVVMVSGLKLSVEMFSGARSVGGTFSWKVDLFKAGEKRSIEGELIVPTYTMNNLSYVITLKSGNIAVDELLSELPTNGVA